MNSKCCMMKDERSKVILNNQDIFNIFLITILAYGMRLWLIAHPDGPVFDEVHFGNFTNWYTLSQFYFDIHPTLGKLLMFAFANLSEYNGLIQFQNPKDGVYNDIAYVSLRLTPAFFSALCFPLLYLGVRFSGFSITAATTGSLLALMDTSLATEGRFILSDGILHFFSCLHIAVACYTFNLPRGKRFNIFHVLNGITLGAASSCKNTAWGLMVFDAYLYFVEFLPLWKYGILDYLFDIGIYGVSLFIYLVAVYLTSFAVHFVLLPYRGQGYGYLPQNMKKHLVPLNAVGCALWGIRVQKPGLIYRTLKLSWIMHTGNMGIVGYHISQSQPFNWPFLTGKDVGFWGYGKQQIKCHGNVFSYYFALMGVVLLVIPYKRKTYLKSLRFVVGYCACYFPFYLIPRTMYLYHYNIPLMIACMSYGAALDIYLPKRAQAFVGVITIALAAFGFWLWMPYVYGKYMHDQSIMIWNKNWVEGDAHFKRAREIENSKNAAKNR